MDGARLTARCFGCTCTIEEEETQSAAVGTRTALKNRRLFRTLSAMMAASPHTMTGAMQITR